MSTPEGDNVYNVEEIVGYRHNNGREEYLIKWEGYSEEDNTWEPASNLDEGSLKIAKAYCDRQKEQQSGQKPQARVRRLKRKRRQEIIDSDDEFISDADDSYLSDGTYHDRSAENDSQTETTMPVTPSPPQKPRRVCYAKTTEQIRKTNQELSSDDEVSYQGIVTKKKARRNIFHDESDDSDTVDDNENCNHDDGAKLPLLPLLPPSQTNLTSSPTKLKTTTMQCCSSIDAFTKTRLPYPSRSPHVCFIDSDGTRYCYALDTLYRVAIKKYVDGQNLPFLQPPHFDSPMSDDLVDQIACRFGRQALRIENSKNFRRYYERFVLGLTRHDLYCCPICYNEASRRRGNRWVDDDDDDDDDDDENSDEEFKEECFSFNDDPMTILGNVGSSVASTFCFLKVKGIRMHLQDAHSVDLGELKGNDLFKRFAIRSPDGLLQHFVGSHRVCHNNMWSYWQHDQNSTSFRNLVQLVEDNEDKKPAANRSDFCTSFPNRARQIWEKVSGPYLKDDDSTGGKKFINDDILDEDTDEVRKNPYFDPSSDEEEINQYVEDLKQRDERNRESEDDASSSDESDSYANSFMVDDSEEYEESGSEEDDDEEELSEDPWLKEKTNKMKQKREKRRSIPTCDDEDSDDEIMFEADIGQAQASKCAKFTASDDEE